MNEAYNAMLVIINNENNSIKEINDEKLILSINILNLDKSYRERKIELMKKKQNSEVIIGELCKIIAQLKQIILI